MTTIGDADLDASDLDAQVQHLLERAAGIKLVALGFAYPADGLTGAVREAFGQIASSPAVLGPGTAVAFDAARMAWSNPEQAALQLEFTRLFSRSAACSPHETSYGDARRIAGHGVELADISGFYEAFGFTLSTETPDLPDHLCAELEFYSLLLVKQAYARHTAATEHDEVTAHAACAFLEHHLGRWIQAFVDGLGEHQAAPAYLPLGRLLLGLIQAECEHQGVYPTLLQGRLPPDFTRQDDFTCPMAEPEPSVPPPDVETLNG